MCEEEGRREFEDVVEERFVQESLEEESFGHGISEMASFLNKLVKESSCTILTCFALILVCLLDLRIFFSFFCSLELSKYDNGVLMMAERVLEWGASEDMNWSGAEEDDDDWIVVLGLKIADCGLRADILLFMRKVNVGFLRTEEDLSVSVSV